MHGTLAVFAAAQPKPSSEMYLAIFAERPASLKNIADTELPREWPTK